MKAFLLDNKIPVYRIRKNSNGTSLVQPIATPVAIIGETRYQNHSQAIVKTSRLSK